MKLLGIQTEQSDRNLIIRVSSGSDVILLPGYIQGAIENSTEWTLVLDFSNSSTSAQKSSLASAALMRFFTESNYRRTAYRSAWIWFRKGISLDNPGGTGWQKVDGSLAQISAGPSGVWGVDANEDIFYREGTYGGHITVGSGWTPVSGKLTYITSGSGMVLGVSSKIEMFRRTGISETNPTGYKWDKFGEGQMMIEEYGGTMWIVSPLHEIVIFN
ncbi:hypothetical protein C0Q70_14239 [Pomacea canaliculata]|uniref:Uncharacterized protein n=1 Tax=Pomacea canaliculata TaxID=400727 RepID=A0A2T7NZF8_POMCA|nr:hypothetical protein C0Q70_14239 [Pomacea canaliculata]